MGFGDLLVWFGVLMITGLLVLDVGWCWRLCCLGLLLRYVCVGVYLRSLLFGFDLFCL